MKGEKYYLHGFLLKGCWKDLVVDSDNYGKNNLTLRKHYRNPRSWEFTDYDESMLDYMGKPKGALRRKLRKQNSITR